MDIYFNKFPLIYYVVDINGVPVTKIVRDITTNVRIRRNVLENLNLFDEYVMDLDETPEIVAHKYYGSVLLQWVVLLCNQRYDAVRDFPMNPYAFQEYLNDKYQSVKVPTFKNVFDKDAYFSILNVSNDLELYNGSSSDAVKYISETYYPKDTLLHHYGNYYVTLNDGISEEFLVMRNKNSAIYWKSDTYYSQDQLVIANNEYYLVKESGTSDSYEYTYFDNDLNKNVTVYSPPNHISGEEYNGTVLFRSSLIFYKKVTVLDVNPDLQWTTFPTEQEALDYQDHFTSIGTKVKASTLLHHLHHYEDDNGHIINYLNPEPNYLPAPIVLSDKTEVMKTAVDWTKNTYYAIGTLIKVAEDRYYVVTKSGVSLNIDGGEPTEIIGDITFPSTPLMLKNYPLYKEVTNYMYEDQINEEKRHLKLIHKDTLMTILDQLKAAIS